MGADGSARPKFWQLAIADFERALGSTAAGLSSAEAAARLERYGANFLEPRRHLSVFGKFAGRFGNPLVVILLVAAAISAATGDITAFLIIATVVLTSTTLDTVQEALGHALCA